MTVTQCLCSTSLLFKKHQQLCNFTSSDRGCKQILKHFALVWFSLKGLLVLFGGLGTAIK